MIDKLFKSKVLPFLYGRKILLAFANERAIQRAANTLEALGVSKSHLFGIVGQSPQTERIRLDIAHIFVALPECSLAFELRAYHSALKHLDKTHIKVIDDFDPTVEAIVIGAFWFELESVANRRVFGSRRTSWLRIEDKCEVTVIWDKANIKTSRSETVSVSHLKHTCLEGWNFPFVLSGDSTQGVTGGGSHVRAIYTAKHLDSVRSFFEKECQYVRVMEYLDGVSCSIHGVVLEAEVLCSIPIEMVVIPCSDGHFKYMGASTHWIPNSSITAQLQDTVRKVGAVLREEVNFKGTFTLDGVITDGQFYPTEINTRAGAGIFALYGVKHMAYFLLDLMLKDGQTIRFDTDSLQHWMIETAISNRSTRAWGESTVDGTCTPETHWLDFVSGQWSRVEDHTDGATTLSISDGRAGAFLMLSVSPKSLSAGELLKPYVKAAMQYSDKVWGTYFLG